MRKKVVSVLCAMMILKELFLSERKCEVKSTFLRKNEREEEGKGKRGKKEKIYHVLCQLKFHFDEFLEEKENEKLQTNQSLKTTTATPIHLDDMKVEFSFFIPFYFYFTFSSILPSFFQYV